MRTIRRSFWQLDDDYKLGKIEAGQSEDYFQEAKKARREAVDAGVNYFTRVHDFPPACVPTPN